MDGETLTLGYVQTLHFLVVGFLVDTFFAWVDRWDDFLMEGGGDGMDSEYDMDIFFSS